MSRTTQGIAWFKNQFGAQIEAAVAGTPFSLDLLTAIAYQESSEIWGSIFDRLPVSEVLKVCVGDTLDAPARSAFPKNKAALLARQNGSAMFTIARQALVDIGQYNSGYASVAHMNADKFCHGYGIFQYDLQFFKDDPDFFLQKRWYDFDQCLIKVVAELKEALRKAYSPAKTTLTPRESVFVAIAYNNGVPDINGTFSQGFRDSDGEYYGDLIWKYLQIAEAQPGPPRLPRLILSKPGRLNAIDWVSQAMATATFVGGHFEMDKSEFELFVGKSVTGPGRQTIRDLLTASAIPFISSELHLNEPADPREYIFLQM